MAEVPVLRVARACSNLAQARRFYCDALGFSVLAQFENHDGFDGLVVGHAAVPWHLELVVQRSAPVQRPSVGPDRAV